jgi:LytS/YehU family sensor histidine kinase
MCVLLAEFLRSSLRLGERETVSLAEELELVRTYLAIEQIRFGDRLRVDWAVDADAGCTEVPPLLLQPLVENAIKHGVAQLTGGGTVLIAVAVLPDRRVGIRVENARDPGQEAPAGLGMGLRQVRLRLRGRYGPGADFAAGARRDRFEVVLALPMEPAEVSHA